jgi:hypothetical protein
LSLLSCRSDFDKPGILDSPTDFFDDFCRVLAVAVVVVRLLAGFFDPFDLEALPP